jgi:hypothetical protein
VLAFLRRSASLLFSWRALELLPFFFVTSFWILLSLDGILNVVLLFGGLFVYIVVGISSRLADIQMLGENSRLRDLAADLVPVVSLVDDSGS